ncbi:MAG: branched-chain amino acid ABC transporter substrate-binding protein [Deferribacteraceae bacterium]|jgi:branched-chain amino acid transport system substrate-binding protein|nr:branched-chain amino acid ABC transporter substrate-binding protein [Deferribacteraceae bacterium]
MKKYFLVLIMILILFCACNRKTSNEFVVGVQAPITGEYASEGQGMSNAVKLIVQQQNDEGGLNGVMIKVITCDDEGSPQKASICAKKLVNDGAKVVIGSYTSTATAASQEIYANASVIQTSDATAAVLTQGNYKTYFRASFNDDIEGEFTANYFVNVKKYGNIAIISDYSSFSSGLAGAVVKNIGLLGGNIVCNEKIDANAQDFKAVLTKIKALNPDVIYFSGYYTQSGLLRAQQVQLDIQADYVGGNATDNPQFIEIAGEQNAIDSYLVGLPVPEQLDYPEALKFNSDYLREYKAPVPSIWTVINADGLRVVFEAMKQVNTNDTIAAIEHIKGGMKDFRGLTGPITIQRNGERAGSIYRVNVINSDLDYETVYYDPVSGK